MKSFRKSFAVISCIGALLALASPAFAQQALHLPTPEIEKLPNGLTVAWFVSPQIPVIDLGVLIQSGNRDDLPGKSGTAELVSSLLDRGAAGMTAKDIALAAERLGASRFASVDDDSFSIGVHGLSVDSASLLDLLGKMVIRPDFPEAEVQREHERMLDRWSHLADYGDTLAGLAFRRLLTSNTPYGRGSFLSADEFKKVGREDVIRFHERHFIPKNSVLMVVGRVEKESFRDLILKSFSQWSGEAPVRENRKYADSRLAVKKGQILLVDRPGLTQAQVRIGSRSLLFTAPERYALSVGNAMLGEYFNSRLNSLVRDKLGLTYSISSGFAHSKELGVFSVGAATRNETAGQLIRKLLDVVKGLRAGPIPDEELKMAKDYLVGGFPLANSTLGSVASRWLGGYVFNMGPDYLNEFIPRVEKIGSGDVIEAFSKGVNVDDLIIVVAGDAKAIEPSLREAKLGPVKKIAARDLR